MTDRSTESLGDAPVFRDETGDLPENLLRHYAAVLRRRLRWVALGLFVGLLAGVGSTCLVKKHRVTTHYFKATNTLVVDTANGKRPASDSSDHRSGPTAERTPAASEKAVGAERTKGLTEELSEFWSKRGGGPSNGAPTNGSEKRPDPDPATGRGSD